MEYQFTHTMKGVVAKCSMEHEAFAHWLNTEIVGKPDKLETVLNQVALCKSVFPKPFEWIMEGSEYSLSIDTDEVLVKANNFDIEFLFDDPTVLEEGLNFYTQESVAFCGLEDFEKFIKSYQQFLRTYH